jgi:hypothetical protein
MNRCLLNLSSQHRCDFYESICAQASNSLDFIVMLLYNNSCLCKDETARTARCPFFSTCHTTKNSHKNDSLPIKRLLQLEVVILV